MAAAPEPSLILSFEDARHIVEGHGSHLRPRSKELLKLLDSAGRILAEPVAADRNFPPFRRATRDGYAVRAADLVQLPAKLRVIGEIRAGAKIENSEIKIESGEAVAIMTGAPAPAGAALRPHSRQRSLRHWSAGRAPVPSSFRRA